ncbi:MAG: hypothetical protein AB4426_33935 [Xenococcaceae cyanobacterium]
MLEIKNRNFLAGAVVVLLGAQGLTVCLQIVQTVAISRLSLKAPTLVQLTDGSAIVSVPVDVGERAPKTIQRFVSDTFYLMFNWSGKLPSASLEDAKNPISDSGVPIMVDGRKFKIATSSWQGSFAFAEDFRTQLVQKIAKMTPQQVFDGKMEVILVIDRISEPQVLERGWKVDVVAHLNLFAKANALSEIVPLNKEVFVEVVEVPAVPKGNTPLEKAVYSIRQAGLQIYAMRDLQQEDF